MNKISEVEMIRSFDLAVVPEIRGRVRELKVSDGENWETFIQALKEEFFMKDSERVTKKTFWSGLHGLANVCRQMNF